MMSVQRFEIDTMKKLISIREACEITTLSRTSVWQRVKDDHSFPKPVELGGGRKAFLLSEIETWIDERLAERDGVSWSK